MAAAAVVARNKGATGPVQKRVSAGVEQRNLPSEETGRVSSGNGQARRHAGGRASTSVPAIQRNPPRGGPQPNISMWPLTSCQSALMGDGGCAPPPVPSFLGRGDSAGPCSPSGEAKKFPQTVSSIHGSVAPIFQKLTIEVSVKQPPPPPLLQRLAGSGNPSALGKRKAPGATGPQPRLLPSEGVEGTRL